MQMGIARIVVLEELTDMGVSVVLLATALHAGKLSREELAIHMPSIIKRTVLKSLGHKLVDKSITLNGKQGYSEYEEFMFYPEKLKLPKIQESTLRIYWWTQPYFDLTKNLYLHSRGFMMLKPSFGALKKEVFGETQVKPEAWK